MDPGPLPPPLFDPIVSGSGVTIHFGDGGVGKSLLALAVAASLGTGLEVIEGFKPSVRRGPVYYVDFERNARETVSRLRDMGLADRLDDEGNDDLWVDYMSPPVADKRAFDHIARKPS